METGYGQCMALEQLVCAVLLCHEQRAVLQCMVCSEWCMVCSARCAFLAVEGSLRVQVGLVGHSSPVST